MPEGFDGCVSSGGRVRTVKGPSKKHGLKKGEFVRFCFADGQSFRGETKVKKPESKLSKRLRGA